MKVLPVILSCLKNKHLWQNLLTKHQYSIIFCGAKINREYILHGRILYLNCDDNYEGLPEKIICMINAILQIKRFSHITHIIKIDDHDTNMSNLKQNLNSMRPIINANDYLGQSINYQQLKYGEFKGVVDWHFNKCSKKSHWYNKLYTGIYTPWADGGCGYILSVNAMRLINSKYGPKDKEIVSKNHIFEDLMIALILYEHNIHPVKIDNVIVGDKYR